MTRFASSVACALLAATAAVAAVPAAAASRLNAISTRMKVLTGNDVAIAGFIVSGTAAKTVVVRGRGPSLGAAGMPNSLADPVLQLVRASDQALIGTNDNWQTDPRAAQLQASGYSPTYAAEAALLVTLAPGAYTAIVSGAAGGIGAALAEVFELDHPEAPLLGISTRGQVLTGNEVMIAGLIIVGDSPQSVVVRARGPSLAAGGITNALENPTLTLVRTSDARVMATNDNWQTAQNAGNLVTSGFAPTDAKEAAVLVTLEPGAYTAVVEGVGGSSGVAIVEAWAHDIWELAPANASAKHKGVIGQTYTYYLPRSPSGFYGTGFLQQGSDPFTPTELTVEWAISRVPGDFDYYKQPGNAACGGTNGAAAGAYYWSISPASHECRVDNINRWYINVRYLDHCAPGVQCPVSYFHAES
jgi:hypothetical protein